ncbi:helix-turn-helix domain-containing protein [Mucilaginibacter terrae]|uniref:HTH-type transcriptional regulator/antitoxin HigA n=1 Tax=Mucilaginibacter terrae TaxID=1955052 RepID=A0ABU3GML3_9SPHI|nr:helix-turn-helix domain-containing protein [Mucilaginibacter terrae]MDT3401024.1 HTH-type transcriptional regulator/antitoxin HigA [Mucilaginibacter terrae]
MKNEIKSDADYQQVMTKIDGLMAKGSANVTQDELSEIRTLAQQAQAFEQAKYVIDAPTTLIGMVEMRMFEMKLKQRDLAQKLNISDAKLSLIMNGKQRPGVDFLKAVYQQLHIDAGFLLEHA